MREETLERIAVALEALVAGMPSVPKVRDPGDLMRAKGSLRPPAAEPVNLDYALSVYLGDVTGRGVSEAHAKILRRRLERFVNYLGQIGVWHLHEVTPMIVLGWRDTLEGSTSTRNAYIGAVTGFFSLCVKACMLKSNPAKDLKLRQLVRPQDQRGHFTDEELGRVFSRTFKMHARRGDSRPSHYWLPLIMLYSGARPEEVAQLRRADVRDGGPDTAGWYFDFETVEHGQKRKTEASRRLVPVHPRLLELGLVRYLENDLSISTLGGGGGYREWLFPELSGERRAVAPSRWFNEFWLRKVVGITDPRKVLYSLRHTTATQLKCEVGVPEVQIAQLLGHAHSSITTGRYGKAYDMAKMRGVVELLEFPTGEVQPW